MTRWTRTQFDLFETTPSRIELTASQRAKALELLRAMLMEAMAPTATAHDVEGRREADNDEDHA
jgi:hypothetical protein